MTAPSQWVARFVGFASLRGLAIQMPPPTASLEAVCAVAALARAGQSVTAGRPGASSMWRSRTRSALGVADISGPFHFAAEVGAQEARRVQVDIALEHRRKLILHREESQSRHVARLELHQHVHVAGRPPWDEAGHQNTVSIASDTLSADSARPLRRPSTASRPKNSRDSAQDACAELAEGMPALTAPL
jgi:hypothetical protein